MSKLMRRKQAWARSTTAELHDPAIKRLDVLTRQGVVRRDGSGRLYAAAKRCLELDRSCVIVSIKDGRSPANKRHFAQLSDQRARAFAALAELRVAAVPGYEKPELHRGGIFAGRDQDELWEWAVDLSEVEPEV
jgi:hypothetical protein